MKKQRSAEQSAREEEDNRLLWAASAVRGWEIEDCEEATNLLYDRFTSAHARSPRNPDEVFTWGGTLDDAALIAIGFHARAVFDYWREMVVRTEQAVIAQMAMEERKGATLQ